MDIPQWDYTPGDKSNWIALTLKGKLTKSQEEKNEGVEEEPAISSSSFDFPQWSR